MSPMRVLVVGAHHGVGALFVTRAREAGYEVTTFEGDVLDEAAVQRAMSGCEAVVSTLGPRKGSPPDLCSRGTRHLVDAMKQNAVARVVQVTGAMIGHDRSKLGWVYRFILSRVPKDAMADRQEQERRIIESGLQWTLVRPTRLTDGPARGAWRSGGDERVRAFAQISRADVAECLLRALGDPSTLGRALTLQY